MQAPSLAAVSRGCFLALTCRLLTAAASLLAEHGFWARGLQYLEHMCSAVSVPRPWSSGSVVVAHGFSCSSACGISPDQGWNPCLLHWQVDSLPLSHQGSPIIEHSIEHRASLVARRLKRLPTMQETWVRSLGREDPLEKEMTTHSSIRAWKIPWTEEPGGLHSMGSQKSGTRLNN